MEIEIVTSPEEWRTEERFFTGTQEVTILVFRTAEESETWLKWKEKKDDRQNGTNRE